jgi:hypothetical protein
MTRNIQLITGHTPHSILYQRRSKDDSILDRQYQFHGPLLHHHLFPIIKFFFLHFFSTSIYGIEISLSVVNIESQEKNWIFFTDLVES